MENLTKEELLAKIKTLEDKNLILTEKCSQMSIKISKRDSQILSLERELQEAVEKSPEKQKPEGFVCRVKGCTHTCKTGGGRLKGVPIFEIYDF